MRHRPGCHRQHQPRGQRRMVDHDVLLADICGGEPLLAERDLQRDPGGNHFLRHHRITRLDRESLAQWRRLAARLRQPGEIDRLEFVQRTRSRAQRDRDPLTIERDPRIDLGIIIALRLEQAGQQLGIGPRAAVDLRRIGRLATAFLKRRLALECREQHRAVLRADPFDPHHIAPRRRRILDRSACVGSLGGRRRLRGRNRLRLGLGVGRIHVGPVDPQSGHRIHRRIGVECGRIRLGRLRLQWRMHGADKRRHCQHPCPPAL